MPHINPIWLSRHQQRRWMRPNAHLYIRPDASRWSLPSRGGNLPREDRFSRLPSFEGKANFNPDQPRVPAGNPDGGQWTDGSSTDGSGRRGSYEHGSSKRTVLVRRGSRPHGHHAVPVKIYGRMNLREDTRKVFDEAKTGRLRGQHHRGGKEHDEYTDAVGNLLKDFMNEHNIKKEEMTPDQAHEFVDKVRRSNDPKIRDFNMKIWRRELYYWIRRGPRGRE